MAEFRILGLKLEGGGMCPEQYDVYRGERKVGYLRLRHGCFTADYIDGERELCVYTSCPDGDGSFEDWEREFELTCAVIEIIKADRIVRNRMVDALDAFDAQEVN